MKIGIQAAQFGKEIHGGTLNADGTRFTGEIQDVTTMAVLAVGRLTQRHFRGDGIFEIGNLKIEVKVSELNDHE